MVRFDLRGSKQSKHLLALVGHRHFNHIQAKDPLHDILSQHPTKQSR
jgi:hypothetical protein